MRIGVLGPGVVGSAFGARLRRAGHDVTMIARGARLQQLEERGLDVVDAASGERLHYEGIASGDLASQEPFDWLIVSVRADQATAALEQVARDDETANVVTLINHARGIASWTDLVGERLCFGFPGVSGAFEDHVVRYRLAPARVQPTMMGERDGSASPRIREMTSALTDAGIPSAIESDVDAWLRFHVAWIHVLGIGVANAGSIDAFRADGALRARMVDAMREGLDVVERLGFELTPAGLRWLRRLPRGLLAFALKRMVSAPDARAVFTNRSEGQRREGREMIQQMRDLAKEAGVSMPAHDALTSAL